MDESARHIRELGKPGPFRTNLRRVFFGAFAVTDIAEPLVSYDAEQDGIRVRQLMDRDDFDVAGVRLEGRVAGMVRRDALREGPCGAFLEAIPAARVVPADTVLADAIVSLLDGSPLFVTILGRVGGIATPFDLQKPAVRMLLFGAVTLLEMGIGTMIRECRPGESWRDLLSPARIAKAEEFARQSGRGGELLPSLQFGDKAGIVGKLPEAREFLGFASRRDARSLLHSVEELRNTLAHGQPIGTEFGDTIRWLLRAVQGVAYADGPLQPGWLTSAPGGDVPR